VALKTKGYSPTDFLSVCDETFKFLVAENWSQHQTAWSVREFRRRWKFWPENLAAALQSAVDGREAKDGRRVGAYADSPEYKAAKRELWTRTHPKPEHDEDEALDYDRRAVSCLREANHYARRCGMATIVEPKEWLEWRPGTPATGDVVIPKLEVTAARSGGMRSVSDILAGKHKRGPLNLSHPKIAAILDVLFTVFQPEDIRELFSNGTEILKARR